MAFRGRADWRGRGRGRGRSPSSTEVTSCGQSASARNYGIGRGKIQVEPTPPFVQSPHEEKQTSTQLETEMSALKLHQVQGGDVLSEVVPGLEQHTEWIKQLTSAGMQGHQLQALSQMLANYFQTTSDPYRTALYMTYKSPGFYTNKGNTLCMIVIKEFDKWLKKTTACPVCRKLKYLAFDIAFQQRNSELIKRILNIYQVVDEPHLFLDNVKHFVLRRKYKEACVAATLLRLQQFFDIKEVLRKNDPTPECCVNKTQIVVPLMLQDSLCFVEDYLADNTEQQHAFLSFVDGLCTRDAPIQPLLIEMSEVPDIKREKCIPRIFRKLCTRLMKKFNVPPEICPNVAQGKNTGAVRYLLYKKYVEQSVDSEDWDELIEDAVRNDVTSQQELVLSLACYNDIPCAAKFAQKYSLPVHELPRDVQRALEGNTVKNYEPIYRRNTSTFQTDSWGRDDWGEVPEEYHQLSLPQSAILFVDDRTKFLSFLSHLAQDCRVVGIDGEWKPSFGTNPSKLAVLQLATNSTIYVLDTICLLERLTDDDWLLFVNSLFCNRIIEKLGFGISSDFKMLAEILPAAAATAVANRVNVIDLQTLSSMLYKSSPKIFPYELCNGGNGLTDLTKACLGKSLNKTDQFSNWERRPLRETQLIYAALDAYCLLEIYEVLRRRAIELDIDLDTIISSCTKTKSKASRPANKPKQPTVPASPPEYILDPPDTPCSPGDLSVVVDTMLQGLGRRLRLCGVDVKILQTEDDHDEAAKIAMRETRIILTSGGPYTKLRQYVPQGMCLNVKPGSTKEQVAQVFQVFNVQMTSKDIFSRCQNCNGNRYIKVPAQHMKCLWEKECRESIQRKQTTDSSTSCCSRNLEDNSSVFTYGGTIDFINMTTDAGARLQFEGIIPSVFDRVDEFYVCANCGKVYWIGSHMNRALALFGDMVNDYVG